MPTKYEGVFAALWTPTDAEGELLEADFAANLEFILHAGVHGLMVLGSTGQFLQLELSQRFLVLDRVISKAGSLPVIANISDLRLHSVYELGKLARLLEYHAVALLPPYFYAVVPEDLVEYFVRIGETVGLPLLLYNYAERTGNPITLDIVAAVADRVPLLGIKHSAGDFYYHRALVELGREKGFVVLSGSDSRLAEAMAMGVAGCVSGLANAAPELVVEIFEATRQGESQRAQGATEKMQTIDRIINQVAFPLNVAAAMEARNRPIGEPKMIHCSATHKKYQAVVGELRNQYRQWGLI
jgi:4-hydroxy-tetrahydrodipicolinate synthase